MSSSVKLWLGLGAFAVLHAGMPALTGSGPTIVPAAWAEEQGEGGEGGEGELSVPSSYALAITDADTLAYDARPQIEHHIRHVHASYAAAAEQARRLKAAIAALLAEPSAATLETARAAWLAARPSYLLTETFRFYDGPIEEIEGRINAWPLNEAFIDYVAGDPTAGLINDLSRPIDLATILAADQVTDEADVTTGWHAIEFLLWGQDLSATGPGNRPFTDYLPGRDNNDRRRHYLMLVTEQLVTDLDALAVAWRPDVEDGYAARFRALPPREALGRILNGMAILAGFELMSERLAVALDSGDQEDEHSCFSDNTKADFVYNLQGIEDVWMGQGAAGRGPALRQLVEARNAELAVRIDALFAAAKDRVATLGEPWDQVLAAPADSPERQAAEATVVALQNLAAGLRDAGTAIGVLVVIPAS